jgi:hypothetical protein
MLGRCVASRVELGGQRDKAVLRSQASRADRIGVFYPSGSDHLPHWGWCLANSGRRSSQVCLSEDALMQGNGVVVALAALPVDVTLETSMQSGITLDGRRYPLSKGW